MLTDNNVLVSKHIMLPAISCAQNKAAKKVPTEDDFIKSDIGAFGNDIGSITNRATSMFEVRSGFAKDSEEYKELTYRIRCCQLQQQDSIDKAKGIISKPMPKEWYDFHIINKIEDEEKRNFYRSIMADKKPYFMRYIYPTLMNQYNTYVSNTNKKALREFGLTVDELKAKSYDSLTERQIEFLRYFDRCIPVGTNNCVMNQICRKFEALFDGFLKKSSATDFDYSIMRSDAEYTTKQYNSIKAVYDDYTKRLSNFKAYSSFERVDDNEAAEGLERIKEEFVEECDKLCPDQAKLCNIILDICYSKNTTKRFAWSVVGSEIIKNLLKHNNNVIHFPTLSENKEFEYGGEWFEIKTKEIEVSE